MGMNSAKLTFQKHLDISLADKETNFNANKGMQQSLSHHLYKFTNHKPKAMHMITKKNVTLQ